MSGAASKDVLGILVPQFEKSTGHRVTVSYLIVSTLRQKILSGDIPDMVIIPNTAIENLVNAGKIKTDGQQQLGTVKLVAIVKKGAPRPDISTIENFRAALLKAKSVVYATPGSTQIGAHMANLVSRLDITDAVESKAIYRPALQGGVSMVAEGKADIGIYPASEVVNVKGIASLGTIPDPLQYTLSYVGAVTTRNAMPEPALSLIRYLGAPDNQEIWQRAGFDPPIAVR
ncbi:MAG: substrate-binding domain-containing protein [Xanthobacteraceae bacterium]|nr:substrate-binding domain-containing protein [Xanthobacteraceae bacterium]